MNNKLALPYVLVTWIGAGTIRVLLGSSTSAIAYGFFGIFWLVSVVLLLTAVRHLVVATKNEQRVEAVAICVGLISLFVQGLLGTGDSIVAALLLFLISAVVLLFIYARKLWRGTLVRS